MVESRIRFQELEQALKAKDPDLPKMCIEMSFASDLAPQKIREGALTLEDYISSLNRSPFLQKDPEERRLYRTSQIQALEAEDAEVPLPERFQMYKLLLELWEKNGAYERRCLLEIIAKIAIKWGPWRALKKIFKEAEAKDDVEMLAALAARFDREFAKRRRSREVKDLTLAYMCRRAWRYLRRKAESLPGIYADVACNVLHFYPEDTRWEKTWVANHILYHHSKRAYSDKKNYNRRQFLFWRVPQKLEKAYKDLWKRSPRPLFTLLETAQCEFVRSFAVASLKSDFVTVLREVEAQWVLRLLGVESKTVDEFAVWILTTVPKFEQSSFREMGLHEPILKLLHSKSTEAQKYAASYARTHARDMDLKKLIQLVDHSNEIVRKLAFDLLQDRDPRKDVGVEGWGLLLDSKHGYPVAEKKLLEHFNARDLTLDWFKERFLSSTSSRFAEKHIFEVHPLKTLKSKYFCDLFYEKHLDQRIVDFLLKSIERISLDVEPEFLQHMLVHSHAMWTAFGWFEEEKISLEKLGVDFLKMVAYHVEWEKSDWVEKLKERDLPWVKDLEFDDQLSEKALAWLGDVRKFKPADIGFEWLMELVKRSEENYHEFAVEYMIKAFTPADFAPKKEKPKAKKEKQSKIQADLGGQTFLFTGKLKTMTRKEAKQKVTDAKGKNSSGVNAKLDYLVIGDEGSPLYGQGRKGSKQVAAEKLIADGAGLKIISETAFLQMLSGEVSEVSQEDSVKGCEILWEMACEKKDSPLSAFAIRYLLRHHPDISMEKTDRPVDPGSEIPEEFLIFERVKPLYFYERKKIRDMALEFTKWELARWDANIDEILDVCESPYQEVKDFFAKALLAEDSKEHKRYRILPEKLTVDFVYRFCDSADEDVRTLGMKLIERDAKLAVPEELFRLTESPDRNLLSFVVRILWKLYHDRAITIHWLPEKPKEEKAKGEHSDIVKFLKTPEKLPASHQSLRDFLRCILYRIPPAKFSKESKKDEKIKYVPARKVKLLLTEVFRDQALQDKAFAEYITPVLQEFMDSQGQSERAACMVALVRMNKKYPDLNIWREES